MANDRSLFSNAIGLVAAALNDLEVPLEAVSSISIGATYTSDKDTPCLSASVDVDAKILTPTALRTIKRTFNGLEVYGNAPNVYLRKETLWNPPTSTDTPDGRSLQIVVWILNAFECSQVGTKQVVRPVPAVEAREESTEVVDQPIWECKPASGEEEA